MVISYRANTAEFLRILPWGFESYVAHHRKPVLYLATSVNKLHGVGSAKVKIIARSSCWSITPDIKQSRPIYCHCVALCNRRLYGAINQSHRACSAGYHAHERVRGNRVLRDPSGNFSLRPKHAAESVCSGDSVTAFSLLETVSAGNRTATSYLSRDASMFF